MGRIYTVSYTHLDVYKRQADGIASTHDDKNYELAETETKKAQIGSKVTPAVDVYKRQCGNSGCDDMAVVEERVK